MILQHLNLSCPFHLPLLAVHPSAVPCCSSLFSQRAWATWQQPLERVSITAMYSATFPSFFSRAANFLLLGYTNCSISILYWTAAGSWGSTRHRWPVQAITIPQRPYAPLVWVSHKRTQLPFWLHSFLLFLFLVLTFQLTGCMGPFPISLFRQHLHRSSAFWCRTSCWSCKSW